MGPGNSIEQSRQLPDGSWVALRIENEYPYTEWTHFSLQFLTGQIHPAWYRVFPVGTLPPEWKEMEPASAVDKQTGVEEEDSDKDAEETLRENAGKIGAARKLRAGRYVFESKIQVGDKEVELTGIEFEARRGVSGAGWG
jgi:hypothetical protein